MVLIAVACFTAPLLLQQSLDQSAFDGSSHQAQFKTPEPCYPATPEAMQSPNGPSSVGSLSGNQSSEENKGRALNVSQ